MPFLPCSTMFRVPCLLYRRLGNSRPLRAVKLSNSAEGILISNDSQYSKEDVEKMRDSSGLQPHHYRIINRLPDVTYPPNEAPYSTTTLKFRRADIGRNGFCSQYDPAICFTTKEEMEDFVEYEKVAFDQPILEIRKQEIEKQAQREKEKKEREERVLKNFAAIEEWKQKLRNRMKDKEKAAEKAREERARLLEEVRRFFGYTIDPRDEKFQLLLEHKEKELGKQKKLDQKKKKEEMFMAKLASLEVSQNNTDDS